jgi:hypothetical protein
MADQMEKLSRQRSGDSLSPLEAIALSDKSLFQRRREYVGMEMKRHFHDMPPKHYRGAD